MQGCCRRRCARRCSLSAAVVQWRKAQQHHCTCMVRRSLPWWQQRLHPLQHSLLSGSSSTSSNQHQQHERACLLQCTSRVLWGSTACSALHQAWSTPRCRKPCRQHQLLSASRRVLVLISLKGVSCLGACHPSKRRGAVAGAGARSAGTRRSRWRRWLPLAGHLREGIMSQAMPHQQTCDICLAVQGLQRGMTGSIL